MKSELLLEWVRVWENKGLPPIQHPIEVQITGDSTVVRQADRLKASTLIVWVRLESWRSIGAWPVHYDGMLECGRGWNYGIRGISTAIYGIDFLG